MLRAERIFIAETIGFAQFQACDDAQGQLTCARALQELQIHRTTAGMEEIEIARHRAVVATRAVSANLAVGAAFVTSELYSAVMLGGFGGGIGNLDQLGHVDRLGMITGIVSFVAFIVTSILVARWIMAANRAARTLSNDLQITPGWAIGWYFIPFANLYKPFTAMSEIWRASDRPDDADRSAVPELLRWWWGLWLASNIVANVSFRLSLRAETLDQMLVVNWINVVSFLLDIGLALAFVRVVAGITQLQVRSSSTLLR